MKKNIALLLVLVLALCLGLCPALGEEEPAPGPAGDWYAAWKGVTMQLTLQPDGAYTLRIAGAEKALSGAWREENGFITLTGDQEAILSVDDTFLRQADLDLFYFREPMNTYRPAGLKADPDIAAYDGGWYSCYVMVEDAVLPAEWAGQDVRMYVENGTVAVTGTRFEQAVVPFTWENGMLSATVGGKNVTLQMQEDFNIRITVKQDGKTTVLIMSYFWPESLIPDGVQAEEIKQ